jgi:hypothetical protein
MVIYINRAFNVVQHNRNSAGGYSVFSIIRSQFLLGDTLSKSGGDFNFTEFY